MNRIAIRLALLTTLIPTMGMAVHYRFEHYGQDKGLNHLAVHGLLQDRKGFIWVTTSNGLYRYDGARFHAFGVSDGLPSPRVHTIHETAQGALWIGTSSGAAIFDGRRFRPVDLKVSREVRGKASISSDKDGNVYIGTNKGLVVGKLSGEVYTFVHPKQVAPVHGVLSDPEGILWFGCGLDLCRMDGEKVTVVGPEAGLPKDRWDVLLKDPKGDLWIRSATRLMVRRRGSGRFTREDKGLPTSTNAPDIALDRDGRLLVATDVGLARQTKDGWRLIGVEQGLGSEAITGVLTDREGSIWVGEWGNGVARWIGEGEWQGWNRSDGLRNPLVWAIQRDKSGAVWVGTDNGLHRLSASRDPDKVRSDKMKVLTKKDGLGENKVKAIATGPDGDLWVGTSPGGLSRVNPRKGVVARYGEKQGLLESRVIGLFADCDDRLWVSTATGLFRSTPVSSPEVRFERQHVPGGDSDEMFFRFFRDREQRLWVGAAKGLACWSDGKWTRLTTREGLKRDSVTNIGQSPDGAIWISYREPLGVSRLTFSQGKWALTHLTQKDVLSSNYVLFFGSDTRGWLWVGTDSGIDILQAGKWRHVRQSDGLIWDDCAANGFMADVDGGVWIGTLNGLSHFHPLERALPKPPPPIYLTRAEFGGSVPEPSGYPRIPFSKRFFQVEFASPSFRDEKMMSFRYRLAGLEENWTETKQHEARYPGLPPGEYLFEVLARTQDGSQSVTPARIGFEILPPWWQTWWFRIMALSALLACVAWTWTWRIRRIMQDRERLEAAVQERTQELVERNEVVAKQKREIEVLFQQAREASRTKSQFLANTSHEIRTPMNAIIGMTSLALQTASPTEQREYLNLVKDSAESLMSLLNEILDLSKIEANRLDLEIAPFAVRECLNSAMNALRPIAAAKGLDLSCHYAPDVPEVVAGDSFRLRQIIWNLVGNSIKFTPSGSIDVSVRRVRTEQDEIVMSFSVQDSGIGIAPEKLEAIFEPFSQADGSTTRKYGGTGLGLAISSHLVAMMGGRIQVESELGKFSRFQFTAKFKISAATSARSKTAAPRDAERAQTPLRILLAEDNAINQMLAMRLLEKEGHTVTVAGTGKEALEVLDRRNFDLILMDVQMPEMDGIEATAAIRRSESGSDRHVPICALTAHAMEGDRQSCLAAGMDAYVSKPIRPEELRAVIRDIVGQQVAL